MREINIAEADIDAVATEIARFASDLPNPEDLVNSQPIAISEHVGVSVRAVDKYIWNRGARGE